METERRVTKRFVFGVVTFFFYKAKLLSRIKSELKSRSKTTCKAKTEERKRPNVFDLFQLLIPYSLEKKRKKKKKIHCHAQISKSFNKKIDQNKIKLLLNN